MCPDLFSLQGKTVFIAAGTSAVGSAIAQECARDAARVVVSGRSRERLDKLLNALPGQAHLGIVADLENENDLGRLVAELPDIDGFVYAAGVPGKTLIKFMPAEEITQTLRINFSRAMQLTCELLRAKKINKGACVLFLSSVAVNSASARLGAYAASKAALEGFARVLAVEAAPRKVRANTLSFGLVHTPMTEFIFGQQDEMYLAEQRKYPLGFGTTGDVACAARYLLSDAARWVSGSDMIVDGGFLAYR